MQHSVVATLAVLAVIILFSVLRVQVVSAVATLTKATTKVSKDSKQKMRNVASSGTAAVKLSKKPLSPTESSRLFSLVAAGNSMKDVCKVPVVCDAKPAPARHLLEMADWYGRSLLEAATPMTPAFRPIQEEQTVRYSRHLLVDNSTVSNTTNGTVTSTASSNTTASPSPTPSAPTEPAPAEPAAPAAGPAFVPDYIEQAYTVAGLLSKSASPASRYVSGGDNGLFVSVSNMLGRSYGSSSGSLVVGPALETTGDASTDSAAENPQVLFSAALKGPCVDEDGSKLGDAPCSDVTVPVRITYLPDASLLVQPTATATRKLAAAATLPADFAFVSGAVTVEPAGSDASGALPCDGCTATITIPIWEEQQKDTLYYCTQVVDGALVLDPVVASSGSVTASQTTPSAPTVACTVNKAGAYLVGKALDPNRNLGTNTTDTPSAAYAGLLVSLAQLGAPHITASTVCCMPTWSVVLIWV